MADDDLKPIKTEPEDSGPLGDEPEEDVSQGQTLDEQTTVKETGESSGDFEEHQKRLGKLRHSVNIYLVLFFLIVFLAILLLLWLFSNKDDGDLTLSGQDLSQESLEELANQKTSVGEVTDTLEVKANAIFNGKVFIKDDLDVAGTIRMGGDLSLKGITVLGTGEFNDLKVNNNLTLSNGLEVSGATTLNQELTVQSSITIAGDGNFDGAVKASEIVVDNFQLLGDFKLDRHIDSGGPKPGISNGSGTGGGGTVSISGTDTAGRINVNTGSNPSNGTLADITFARNFSGEAFVVVSAGNSGAGKTEYYGQVTGNGFRLGTSNAPPENANLIFHYIVLE